MAGRKKGTPKTGGRKPGSTNKTTSEAKQLLQNILFEEFDNIKESLQKVRLENDGKYLDSLSRLFAYVLPKQTDLSIDGEKINLTVNLNKGAKHNI